MEAIMGTTIVGQKLRAQVVQFMSGLPIPESTPAGEAPVQRDDGVLEFYKHWRVRGTGKVNGLYATYADNDDVIEFGLSDRHGDEVRNVLQATLVLDTEHGDLNVASETKSELNVDAVVTPEKAVALEAALLYFAEVLSGREGS
ncbi:hypothetical protein [uncultured Zoogloea sp.]|jgi:hypothetical protein|uniref:hypothetical protein n=1 Tax=uncultured Zoogloea sp. TaxID=160237 RepID=UPI00262A699B|nr:hypothetical protein [uncultured Zoogloea sp.]